MAKCSVQRGILLALLGCLVVDRVIEGVRNGCYTLWYAPSSSAENSPNIVSQLLQEALSMKHAWFTAVPDLLVFYCVLFYSMSILKTPPLTPPPQRLNSCSLLIDGNDIASGILYCFFTQYA